MSVRSPISFLSALSREGETELEKKKKYALRESGNCSVEEGTES